MSSNCKTQRPKMQLDRNANKDGRGKYALIKLRALLKGDTDALINPTTGRISEAGVVQIPTEAISLGNESPGDQFFVMKYKDRFAFKGMIGYRDAVMEYVERRQEHVSGMIQRGETIEGGGIQEALAILNECKELIEYGAELQAEIEQLESLHGTNAVQTPN